MADPAVPLWQGNRSFEKASPRLLRQGSHNVPTRDPPRRFATAVAPRHPSDGGDFPGSFSCRVAAQHLMKIGQQSPTHTNHSVGLVTPSPIENWQFESLSLEFSFPLLEKRFHAFLLIVGAE
jgi:hypothetical protein